MIKETTFNFNQKTWLTCVLLLIFQLGFINLISAQRDKILIGTVLDQDGKPLDNVLVRVPRTTFKTKTDLKGNFTINLPPSAESLIFSLNGKKNENVSIVGKSSLTIRMNPFSGNDINLDGDENEVPVKGKNQTKGARAITGVVIDDNDAIIPGAGVQWIGGSGTITDDNGNFVLQVPSGRGTLKITSVGFKESIVEVTGGQSLVNVILQSQSVNLNEVVVMGYGNQKKINLTGAVSTVDFRDIQNVPQSNTINILQGRMAGVSIVQPGGQPGADGGSVSIRGIGTLNDSSPLVIIDGVPSSLTDLGNLSPAEISTVSVLKDASSASIYGSRGANGVILVKTKEPGNKKLQVNFNAFQGIQSATYLPQNADSWQWMTLQNEALDNGFYPAELITKLKNGNFNDSLANTKWPQELFKPAKMSNYNFSVNGGNQTVSFQANLGYLTQDGLMNNTNTSRYNFRTNVRAQINRQVEIGMNLWGYQQKNSEPFAGVGAIMTDMNQAYPYSPIKTKVGDWSVVGYADGVGFNNPILRTEIGRNDLETFKGNLQTYFQFKPINDLTIRTSATYTYGNQYRERFNPTYSYNNLAGLPAFRNLNNALYNIADEDKQLQWQTTATYNKTFKDKHALTFLAGHEFTNFKNKTFTASGFKLPSNNVQILSSASSDFNIDGSKTQWALQSFFGRANYVFNEKYLFEANLRADGSSRFPKGNKYGLFPAFSAGWIVSKEKFFEGLSNAFTLFKVRGGWGQTGNDRIGNFSFEQYINLTGFYGIGGSGALQPAGRITEYGNPNIKWESTTTSNLGLDIGILKNKVIINADIFERLTNDILFRLPLPSSFGNVTSALQNIGSVSNKGVELNIEHRNSIGKNIYYNLGFNVSYVKNKIEKLNQQESIYGTNGRFILREGEAINSYYGYVSNGLFRDSSDIAKYPKFSTNGFQLGTLRFNDADGNGVINPDDRRVLGNANTPWTYGITGNVSYKGFDASLLLQGVKGKKIYIYDFGNRPGNAGNSNFWKEWWDNRYDQVNNPTGTWPVLKRNAPEVGQTTNTFFLQDASFLRVKNIELGYSLSKSFLSKIRFRTARIYVSGQNLFTFSKLIKQIDPERNALVEQNNTYPQTKVMTVGINAGF